MRFLGIGDTCDLGALYMRLLAEGHEVKVSVANPLAQGTMAGLVEHTSNWEHELDWLRAAGDEGIILFENVAEARGTLQDRLRADGFHVIGGSAYGDRLENDRAFAQRVLADIGLQTANVFEFDDVASACKFIDERPARYVLKFNGPNFSSYDNYVGRLSDGADVRALLRTKFFSRTQSLSFVLMEHVQGVEMGVGGYFNGENFIGEVCLDWEHKRFFPGNLGELTGEMGTIATYDRSRKFFERTLKRMVPLLAAGGYCGYINLNTIVNERGIWPLEFTCRFGYPGFAVLGPLQQTSWSELFRAMTSRQGDATMLPGFCAAIVLTTPPFPYDRETVEGATVGLPVMFDGGLGELDRDRLYYGEVGIVEGQLVTSGKYGWTMVATAVADGIEDARRKANELAQRIIIPNVRYRLDIGTSLFERDFAFVENLGFFDPL